MRKLSLSLAALALLGLVGLASTKPAHADPIVACGTANVQGHAITYRVLATSNMSYKSVDPYNCEVGILVYGPVKVTLDHVNVNGHFNNTPFGVTLADVAVAGGATVTVKNSGLTGALVGVFQEISNVTLQNNEIASNFIGVLGYNKYTSKLNLTGNDIYDNLIGVNAYYSTVTSSNDKIHENLFAGVYEYVSKGSWTNDQIFWNQGDGLFAEEMGTGSILVKGSHVYGNGFGSACDMEDPNSYVFCDGLGIEVNILNIQETATPKQGVLGLEAGIENDGTHINLDNTKVDQNYNGIQLDSDSSTDNIYDFSHVCNNINLNFSVTAGFYQIDGTSSSCGA